MKRILIASLAVAGIAFLGSCERQDWEVTKKLHHHGEAHGGGHAAEHGDGVDASHAEGGDAKKEGEAAPHP